MPRWFQEVRCPQPQGKRLVELFQSLWPNNGGLSRPAITFRRLDNFASRLKPFWLGLEGKRSRLYLNESMNERVSMNVCAFFQLGIGVSDDAEQTFLWRDCAHRFVEDQEVDCRESQAAEHQNHQCQRSSPLRGHRLNGSLFIFFLTVLRNKIGEKN